MPTSMISTMLGWRTALMTRASLMKRRTSTLSSASDRRSTLMAAFQPITVCSARYTVPIPPSPSRAFSS
jgi:hypothetical protein